MRGLWISFEGGEGSGKTTLIQRLAEWAKEQGWEILVTREPGGVPIAERIRDILLDQESGAMDPITEAMLFAAARRQHLVEKVLPALKSGKLVLMDRYVDSSIVYQGYARGLGMERVRELNELAIQGEMPDLTFYIDLSPEEGLRRIRQNRREEDRLDLESEAFHERVREGYLILAKDSERIRVLQGNASPEEILQQMLPALQRMLRKV